MRTDPHSRGGLVALTLTLGLLATSCGGGGSNHPIKIAFITDCWSPFAQFRPNVLAGAELPFLRRGAKLRGSKLSNGVTDATVAGKRVELLLGCESYGDFTTLLGALRQAVENERADIVVGPDNQGEGVVIKEYAREHPEITFSTTSQEQSTTLKHPAPNLFRFAPDAAQASAGLGAYAYRTLGWRNAVTVGEDDPAGWPEVAGFVAEFCSLGGHIVRNIWTPTLAQNFAPWVPEIPSHGVDGVVFPSDVEPAGSFRTALAKRYPHLGDRLLVNLYQPLNDGMVGLVGVSSWPLAPTAGSRRFASSSAHAFPGRPAYFADFYTYDAMEPVLEALKQAHGDLSHGERRLQQALARLTFRAPNGTTSLDGRRQAIAPIYLGRVEKNAHGTLVIRQIGVVPKVEQTFGGFFSPATPPPSRRLPACRRGTPPAWASSVPTTK
jgi:branched-chain amino acid transport system substrate-binding protein